MSFKNTDLMETQSSLHKIQIIDLVRTFSILIVLAVHLQVLLPSPQNGFLRTLWTTISVTGFYGVSLFFIISGFLITRLIDQSLGGLFEPDIRTFYIRRTARILPLLALIILFGLFIIYGPFAQNRPMELFFKDKSTSFDGIFWASIFTFSFNWLRIFRESTTPIFGLHWDVLWSLSIEEQFYLFYPLLLKRLKNILNLKRFLVFFIVAGPLFRFIAYVMKPSSFLLLTTNSFAGFEGITMGILLYLTAKKNSKILSQNKRTCVLLCILGFTVMLTTYIDSQYNRDLIFGQTFLGLGLFLFLLGGLHLNWFESKLFLPLALPGKVSYGMYLWHASVFYFLLPLAGKMNVFTAFALIASVTFAAASLSYHFYEMPMNRLIRKSLGSHKSG
ncbi:MAG TPA: acyltransferase [bacterium]|nr:acyltransferase [bacterium]